MGGLGDIAGDFLSGGGYTGYGDLYDYLNKGKDAVNQNYDAGRGYSMPFYNAGVGALGQYQNALSRMQDPQGFYGSIMSGYQMSPGAQFQEQEGLNASNAAAAASGMLGSGAQQKDLMKYSQGIAAGDQQNYLQNILGINGEYMGGLQGMSGMGYGAGQNIGNSYFNQGNVLADLYGNMGGAKLNQNQALYGGINDWLNKGMSMAGGFGGFG